jgi:Fic family protein
LASEVPELMKMLFKYRDELIKHPSFHPLIIACRILSAFLHIHPFIDGNGRLGHLMMALYLIRHNYPPIILQGVSRLEYSLALFSLQTKKEPAPLYRMIIENSFNTLMDNQRYGILY